MGCGVKMGSELEKVAELGNGAQFDPQTKLARLT